MDNAHAKVSEILKRICSDHDAALQDLLPLVYDELRDLASGHLRRERPDHTLQPTALVHEAYLKLVGETGGDYRDRRHFMAVASRAMRQILVDHARGRRAAKRGGEAIRVTLDEALAPAARRGVDLEVLDEALDDLGKMDFRKSRVVELRFFGGLTNEDAAQLLGVSPKTTEADWYFARAWLRRAIAEEAES